MLAAAEEENKSLSLRYIGFKREKREENYHFTSKCSFFREKALRNTATSLMELPIHPNIPPPPCIEAARVLILLYCCCFMTFWRYILGLLFEGIVFCFFSCFYYACRYSAYTPQQHSCSRYRTQVASGGYVFFFFCFLSAKGIFPKRKAATKSYIYPLVVPYACMQHVQRHYKQYETRENNVHNMRLSYNLL